MSASHIVVTKRHPPRTVATVSVSVVERIWSDGGRSFEVWLPDGTELTEGGSFDNLPTDSEIEELLPTPMWHCPFCDRVIAESDADMIVEHFTRH